MESYTLERLSTKDWEQLILEWEAECNTYGEDFEDYATLSLPVLSSLVYSAPRRDAGVFGLSTEGRVDVICQANSCFLPGYNGKVLRIRHIVLSPRFEFAQNIEIDDYSEVLIGVFVGAIRIAHDEMPSDHVKFHLKSPAERAFGAAFVNALKGDAAFQEVELRGSWIYLSKA